MVRCRETRGCRGDPEGRSSGRPFLPASGGSGRKTAVADPVAPLAKLLRGAPQESSCSPGGPRCPDAVSPSRHLPLPNSCPCRASPRLAASILVRCRSRPGSGSPCPAGGGTQARSPARGSPGERGAGSILPRATDPASEQGEETSPRADPPPPAAPASPAPRPPGPGWRHSPDDSRAAASWPPAARPSAPARGCCSRSHPGTLCAAGARSESLAESRWRRRGGRASQRASGGAAVRSRSSGALALTPHPGMEGESQAESTGSPPRLRRRGGGEGEK